MRLTRSTRRMRIVHTAKNKFAWLASIIAIGVLVYSPLCTLSCATSDCTLLPKTKTAKQTEPSGHCHSHQDEEQPTDSHSQPNAPEPDRHRDSGDCPTHTDAIAILASAVKAPAVVQQSLPLLAALPEASYVSFDGFAAKFAEVRSFRSPPKRAVISVYRI